MSSSAASVLAAVVARTGSLGDVLDAIAAQVYEPSAVAVIGGEESGKAAASDRGIKWAPSPGALSDLLGPDTTHVWVVHDDAIPKPDALGAMVAELERTEASVAGAKLLKADSPDTLELVGAATDVFGVPYSGLESDERDQEQYDVVRDVSYVSGACMLVRRDLYLGLGGPDTTMAPNAAGIDFSQRARIAGGRVVVVPSAEVLHKGECETGASWREDAGRIRAVIKAYQGVTLAWVLPGAFLTGLLAALGHTFVDRRDALLRFVLAWAWNAKRLPSTLSERRRMRRSRLVGDEELFRYQVKGSVELRELGELLGDRLREQATQGRFEDVIDRGRSFWQQPGFIASTFGALFALLVTRSIWGGRLPVGGFSLPLPASAWATLQAYAGGWNPAGLGTATPLMPAVGAASLVQFILLSKAGLASAVLTVGALVAGLWGTGKMLGRLGIGQWGRIMGALALIGGPASRVLGSADAWPGLLALGAAPWALAVALRPWPDTWRNRIARVAALGLSTGVLAVFAPAAVVIPAVALTLGALVKANWGSALRGVIGGVLALPLLFPWLYVVSPRVLQSGPSVYWSPTVWMLGLIAVTALLVIVFGDTETSAIGGWGALLLTAGAVGARAAGIGGGYETGVAGLITAALGTALLAGAAVDLGGRFVDSRLARRLLVTIGAVGGILLAAGALLLVPGGRAGLAPDRYGDALAFTEARAAADGPNRVLLVGESADLPGTSREAAGYSYRLVDSPVPTLPEGWLGEPGLGDAALASTLQDVLSGNELRPGAALAEFGIRWVVLVGSSPFDTAFETQLDMRPLAGLDYPVFENEVPSPLATSPNGIAWTWEPPRFVGPSTGQVILRNNADPRWGSSWSQYQWANEVDGSAGIATFDALPLLRTFAVGAAVYLLLLIGIASSRSKP